VRTIRWTATGWRCRTRLRSRASAQWLRLLKRLPARRWGMGGCEGGKCAPPICIPGTCNDSGTPNPGSPRVPNPNDHVYVQGFGLIVACLTNPVCRAVAMCLAAALGAALGDFLYQLIRGTCCNWCSIECSALCGCLTLGAGIIIGRLLPPPLGELIGGGAAFGICVGCCGRILGC